MQLNPIEQPPVEQYYSASQATTGKYIEPIDRLKIMSPREWEILVLEFADALRNEGLYSDVYWYGGSGDKGRDIVARNAQNDDFDLYQCKQYDAKLTPSTVYSELGKLCFHTFNGSYQCPKNYFFVSPLGCGSKLLDLLVNHETILSP